MRERYTKEQPGWTKQ